MASIFSKNFYGNKQGSHENSDSSLSDNDIDISYCEDSDEFVPTDWDKTDDETDNNNDDDLIEDNLSNENAAPEITHPSTDRWSNVTGQSLHTFRFTGY